MWWTWLYNGALVVVTTIASWFTPHPRVTPSPSPLQISPSPSTVIRRVVPSSIPSISATPSFTPGPTPRFEPAIQPTTSSTPTPSVSLAPASLTGKVIDQDTGASLKGVLVVIGSLTTRTADDGLFTFKGLVTKTYSVTVYDRAYRYHREKVDASIVRTDPLIISLKQKDALPATQTWTGKVVKVGDSFNWSAADNVVELKQGSGDHYYLFNNKGRNEGFDKYIDKVVRITGYLDSGTVGLREKLLEGIYVTDISL